MLRETSKHTGKTVTHTDVVAILRLKAMGISPEAFSNRFDEADEIETAHAWWRRA
jgi:hypothetical protein